MKTLPTSRKEPRLPSLYPVLFSTSKSLTYLFLLRLFTDRALTLHPRVSVGRDGSDLQCRAGCQAH